MKKYLSHSAKETEYIASQIGLRAKKGECYALFGGLGMGKTAFTRGFAKGIGFDGDVSSPTFALVHEYEGGRLPVFHFDMYRVTSFEDLYSTGFFDYPDRGGVMIIEWSENIETVLPDGAIRVEIGRPDGDDDDLRIIEVYDNK